MHKLTIIENALDPKSWVDVQTDDVIATLTQRFAKFPDNARLYCGQISKVNDVTPKFEADIEALKVMKGDFWLVVYPGTGIDLVYLAYALIAVVAIVAITQRPKIPTASNRNYQSASPNNALSGRTNSQRVNGRIPDIFGTVRSTPDLIAVPYSVFVDDSEFEYCYMCIGVGEYDISEDEVFDGQTAVSAISGESVQIFGPNSSPNDGGIPQLSIGPDITRQVISALRSKSVNGQTLLAPNESNDTVNYNNLVSFEYPNRIVAISGNPVTFVDVWAPGDTIQLLTSDVLAAIQANSLASGNYNIKFHPGGSIEFVDGIPADVGNYIDIADGTYLGKYVVLGISGNIVSLFTASDSNVAWSSLVSTTASIPTNFNQTQQITLNMSGIYTVDTVADKVLTLVKPASIRINNNWNWLQGPGLIYNGGDSSWGFDGATVTIGTVAGDDNWIGPFVLNVPTMDEIICNFVALQGMYKDDGTRQLETDVDLQIEITPCDALGVQTGPQQFTGIRVLGSAATQAGRGVTMFADLTTPGIVSVRARRLTSKDLTFVGTVVDTVQWRDLYASSPAGAINWGNVTTVHAVTQATAQALAVSERQLNMLVTRKLPQYLGEGLFSTEIVATNSADDIISFICTNPKNGNRSPAEVNFNNIYQTINDVKFYFGFEEAGEFCYTFDSDNVSFEEMLKTIADAVFCVAQRRGRVIELSFEQQTDDSILLFNHRNKVPKSETRTSSFGQLQQYDGITYDYVSDVDDAIITFYVPEDQSAVNPKDIQSVGVRNDKQAHIHAYREFNKIKYQTRATEFQALQESEILSLNSRILVADNTRPDIQDGQIEGQNGLIIKLSQPANILDSLSYVIYLQHVSGIVEMIDISLAIDPYHMLLASAPMDDLIVDNAAAVKTLYQIVKESDKGIGSFLVTDKSPQNNFVTQLTCINYDARYYQNDKDFDSGYTKNIFSVVDYIGTGQDQLIEGITLINGGAVVFKPQDAVTNPGAIYSTDGISSVSANWFGGVNGPSDAEFLHTGIKLKAGDTFNQSGVFYRAWMFGKHSRFVDVVRYIGDGTTNHKISHSLGCTVGRLMTINCDTYTSPGTNQTYDINTGNQIVLGGGGVLDSTVWGSTTPTTKQFTVGGLGQNNDNGKEYVALLFAHDTDIGNVIQVVPWVGNGSTTGPIVLPGWQPQFTFSKVEGTAGGQWIFTDTHTDPGYAGPTPKRFVMLPDQDSNSWGSRPITLVNGGFQLTTGSLDLNQGNYTAVIIKSDTQIKF